MKPQCPSCDSRATEKLSAAYTKGIRTSGTNISYSAWANYCAPPEPKTVVGSLGFSLIFVFVSVVPWVAKFRDELTINWNLLLTPYFGGLTLAGIIMIGVIIVRFVLMIHHISFNLKSEQELWKRQWVCRDCTEKFIPESDRFKID